MCDFTNENCRNSRMVIIARQIDRLFFLLKSSSCHVALRPMPESVCDYNTVDAAAIVPHHYCHPPPIAEHLGQFDCVAWRVFGHRRAISNWRDIAVNSKSPRYRRYRQSPIPESDVWATRNDAFPPPIVVPLCGRPRLVVATLALLARRRAWGTCRA